MPPSKKTPADPSGRSPRGARPSADAEPATHPARFASARALAARAGRLAKTPEMATAAQLYAEPGGGRRARRSDALAEAQLYAEPRGGRRGKKFDADADALLDAEPRGGRRASHSDVGDEPLYEEPRGGRRAKKSDAAGAEALYGEPPAGRLSRHPNSPLYGDASEDDSAALAPSPRRGTLFKEGRTASRSPVGVRLASGARSRKAPASTGRVTAAARAESPLARTSVARRVRKRATPAKGSRSARRSQLVPTEAALIWGLLYDLLCLPLWLVGLLTGRTQLRDGMRPLDRLLQFVLSARMTALLITLNLLVFAVEIYTRNAGWSRAAFVAHFTLSTDGLGRGEHLPLLTHFFSHASLMHLGGNMLALFVFGRVVERNLGPWRLISCYLLAAVCSTALSLLVQGLSGRSVPTLGASGAVAGLVALGILLEPLTITFEALLPMPLFLVGWLAIAADFAALLAPGATPDPVDHPAHLGGYLSVLLGYYALKRQHQAQARLGLFINLATLLLMAGLWFLLGGRGG